MKVLGFCEGARDDAGGVGLTGVPRIHHALAERGHHDALVVAGQPMPSARPFLTPRLEDVFGSSATTAGGVVTFPAYGRWYFAPGLYAAAARWASEADFLTMHSLFSYPVFVGYMLARRYHKPRGLASRHWRQFNGWSAEERRLFSPRLARRILESASILSIVRRASGKRPGPSASRRPRSLFLTASTSDSSPICLTRLLPIEAPCRSSRTNGAYSVG